MEKISFSVIISIYNGVDYISQCLDSVMKQLPSNCECVVIDDGIKEIVTCQVENKRYNCASEFADDYIRKRSLLLYSLCNKFYVRSIIVSNSLELKENMAFGEDRVFN